MPWAERIRASRMREICMSGLKRGEEAVSLSLPYSTEIGNGGRPPGRIAKEPRARGPVVIIAGGRRGVLEMQALGVGSRMPALRGVERPRGVAQQ